MVTALATVIRISRHFVWQHDTEGSLFAGRSILGVRILLLLFNVWTDFLLL